MTAAPRPQDAAGCPPVTSAAAPDALHARPGSSSEGASGPAEGFDPPSPSAGSQTWVVELPAGLPLLSLNGREHWAARNRKAQAIKKAAWAMALNTKIPHLQRAHITVEYQPPDRRRRDADNAATASGKPCIDGLVAAGVLPDDECPRYVTGISYRISDPFPRGRLVLHITEVSS